MAKFTVGQRVRVKAGAAAGIRAKDVPGKEAIILALVPKPDWSSVKDCQWYKIAISHAPNAKAAEWALEPLTPPAIDEWAKEQVKKWTKPEPVTELPTVKV